MGVNPQVYATYVFHPPKLHDVFEINASGQTDSAILTHEENKLKKVNEKPGFFALDFELCFGILS